MPLAVMAKMVGDMADILTSKKNPILLDKAIQMKLRSLY